MGEHHYLIRGGLEGRERLRVLGRVMRPTTCRSWSALVWPSACAASTSAAAAAT